MGLAAKKKSSKIKTRTGSAVQKSSQDTLDRFVAYLVSGEWVSCEHLIELTGLSKGTISRAAANLLGNKKITSKSVKDGKVKKTYYKLINEVVL